MKNTHAGDGVNAARRVSAWGWRALVLALALQAGFGLAQANVGRTQGQFRVDQLGSATYSIPIWAPRGPNGLEPSMALTYDSQNGGGYVGAGWALSGISSIARCNRTTAQDGTPAAVALSLSDAFCLDGERLQLTGGTQGEAGSTYQTEIANFEQVTAYGSAGNGPDYFVVQAPNGTQYEYGDGGNSQVLASGTDTAMTWYLDKVTDPAGNTMTISYTAGTGSAVPSEISWTPSSYGASTYDYTMQFAYGTNSAASSIYGYVAGTPVTDTNLLQSITVNYDGTTVKKYALTYQQSPATGAEELKQVEECADAAESNCLSPTTFAYQDPSPGTVASATAALSNAPGNLFWSYDFDGDGSDDLAYCTAAPGLQLQVAFASPSGYGAPIATGIPCNVAVLFGDILGNHTDGILAVNNGTWYYYQWNGSSFVGQSTGLAYQSAFQYVLADVTGAGRPALIEMNYASDTLTIDVRLNTSSGSTASFSSTNTQWYSLSVGSSTVGFWATLQSTSDGQAGSLGLGALKHFDFNGDGRDDLALEYQVMTCLTFRGVCEDQYADHADELISTGSSFSATQIGTANTMAGPVYSFLKFNSDACTDYFYNSVIYVSGCNGSPATTVTVPSSNVIGAMDWNADGRTDILVNNGGTIGIYESTGTNLSSLIATSIPYSSTSEYFGFDPAGDGLEALGVWESQASPATVSYYAHNGAGEPPALLTSITDGYGNTVKPAYVSLSQGAGSTYTPTDDATFPYTNYTAPLYVVSQVTYSDPSNPPNGTYQQTHYYSGAWMNEQGRGFAGFETHSVYDSRNQLYAKHTFDLTFPYTGTLVGDTVTENSATGQTVSSLSNTPSDVELASGSGSQRYFDYVSASTAKQYEVGGTENGELITTKTGSFSYDDYGNLTSSTQTTTDNDGGSPYDGDSWTTSVTNTPDEDASTWCLSLLSESQISYTASNGEKSVTRTRQYTPDLTNCRYTEIVTEPSSSSYKVTEQLGYDSFGNINSDTVTGIGMAARESSANWGTTGQFPMSVTDASSATTQLNYNFSYGLVSSETDPNGLTTTLQYGDGFGRPTQENRPDGTYTTFTYGANSTGPLEARLVVTEEPHDTAGDVITTTQLYSDQLDRPLGRIDTLLDSTQAWEGLQFYDSLGRVSSACPPYRTGTSSPGCTTYTFDILNRVTEVQRPISQTDSNLQTTSYAYAGRTTTITDPNDYTRTLIHDVNGWLRRTKDALGYEIILGYDAAGAKTSTTDSLGNTLWTGTYAYGISPFLIGESNVDRGTWGYTVDALGERTAWTDPKAQHFYATYDALSRPLTRTEPDLFTQWTWGSTAASHNIGQLASVCTGSGSTCSMYSESESYDSDGRLSQRAIAIPGMGTYTYTWQYNATTGFLDTLTYPVSTSGKALELKYAYQNGILQSITDVLDSPNVTVWQAGAVNPAEQITEETLGNGLVTTRAYDDVTHWLSSVESGPGGGASIQNQSFLYDEVGNVTQRQDNNLGLTENFYYDHDYRLSYSTLNGTQNLSLNYSPMGNITSRSDVANNATWTYDPVHLHEVTEAGSSAYQYAYDPNGNVKSRQGNLVTWSSYNYPTQINNSATSEEVSFTYGPDRRAWLEQTQGPSGTETAYHVGGLFDIVLLASGAVTDYRHYIYANGEPVAIDSRQSNGTNAFHYLLSDQEGSVADITNSAGAVAVGESFTAYGNRRNPTTWSGAPSNSDLTTIAGITRQGYTFQDALGTMGLNDMVGRVQDAVTGRFLSADPNIPDPTDPQSYNQYSYTRNNPLTYTDPSGFDDDAASCGDNQSCGGNGGGLPAGVEPLNFTFDATMEDDSQSSDPSVQLQPVIVTGSAINGGDEAAFIAWQNTQLQHAWVRSPFGSGSGTQQQSNPQNGHHYSITTSTFCSASDTFNSLKAPDASAPGAPAAQEGTHELNLTGGNPILQTVNTPAMTIVNTTLPGHVFYPGTVTISVTPAPDGAVIQITGTGTGADPFLNDIVGNLLFGGTAALIQNGCALEAGAPYFGGD